MAMVTTQVLSPAKINLMLRVVGQRDDGYHLLQTCFQLLDWGDEITFKQVRSVGDHIIEIAGFEGLDVHENLIYQAAQVLKPWAGLNSDWLVEVDKKIPFGSGLGGGSSNAATVLNFFNQAWQCNLDTLDLLTLATKLGADVPVFVNGQSALAEGVGEELTPMRFDTPYILLLFPGCHINTAELFKAPHLKRDQSRLLIANVQKPSFWINDFMPVVLQQFPAVNNVYQRLKSTMNLRLSGSGATLFALFDNFHQAQSAQKVANDLCKTQLVQPLPEV